MENSSSDDEYDHRSQRFEDYSVSADVSESESCGASSFDSPVASTSRSTPPLVGGPHFTSYLPVVSPIKPSVIGEAQSMKDRFSKLLLGEDMAGRENGVRTALAISKAITRLSATVFDDLWKLEPLSQQNKSMRRKELYNSFRSSTICFVDDATKKRAAAEAGVASRIRVEKSPMRGSSWSLMVTTSKFTPSSLSIGKRETRQFLYSSTSNIDTIEEALERLTFN